MSIRLYALYNLDDFGTWDKPNACSYSGNKLTTACVVEYFINSHFKSREFYVN